MKTKKHLKITVAISSGILALFMQIPLALALPGPRYTCDEGVHPYNANLPATSDDAAISHKLGVVCKSDLEQPFPDQHIQPVNPINHNPVNPNTNVPGLKHTHQYFNDSDQNDGTNNYYKALMWKYEIKLQDDFMNNVDLSTLKCAVPDDGLNAPNPNFADCEGEDNYTFGGTKLHRVGNTITYEFGWNQGWQTDQFGNVIQTGKPIIPGINPNIDQGVYFNKDTTNEDNRTFIARIDAKTKSGLPYDAWSATTTSRVLIQHLAIPQNAFNSGKDHSCKEPGFNANTAWCGISAPGFPTEVTPGGNIYHWFPIGTVVTVWKDVATPEACTNLDILQNGQNISGQSLAFANNINNLTVDATTTPGMDLKFKWQAKTGLQNVGLFTSPLNFGQTGPLNPLSTGLENTAVNYSGSNPNGTTTVTVNAYKQTDNSEQNIECSKSFTIQPQSQNPGCQNLNLNYLSDTFPANATIPLHADPKNTTAPHPASVQWSETGAGVLTRGAFSQTITGLMICPTPVDNTPFTALATCDYNYTTPATGSGSLTISAVPNDGNNAACTKTITFQNGGPVCTDLVLTPSQLDSDNVTNLNATAIFSDGQTHQATVQWSGNNGTFTGNVLNQNNQQASANNNFQVTFSANSSSSEASAQLISAVGADLGVCNGLIKKSTPPPACIGPVVFQPQPSGDICISFGGSYNGPFQWTYGNPAQTKTTQTPCLGVNLPPNTPVSVFATQSCQGSFTFPSPNPPTLEKGVKRAAQATTYKHLINVPQTTNDLSEVEYQLKFTPDPSTPNLTTTIIDDMNKGYIQGVTGLGIGGRIDYVEGSMQVKTASGSNIPKCPQPGACYSGDMGKPGGVTLQKINGQVIITYRGRIVNSAITEDNCQNTLVCQEKYPNTATAKNMSYQPQNNSPAVALPYSVTDNALVQIFCRYILARAAGDIYLETDLKTGIDISKCSEYKNTTGITITPENPKTPEIGKTGKAELVTISHDICTKGQSGTLTGELKNYYGQGVSQNLSSQICEVRLRPGTAWKQKTIVDDVSENLKRISRWDPTLPEGASGEINDLVQTYPNQKVYHIKGGDLRVDYSDFTLSDGQGAKTFIVENGDLIINNNINYGGCNKIAPEVCNVRDIASLAFIVLNGNIYVDPTVTTISGVFFVQKGQNAQNGLLVSGSEQSPNQYSEDPLTVYGSIYGDIQPLFEQRYYAGDATQEDSGILIRFDERIILNTPAGLQDILRASSTEIAG